MQKFCNEVRGSDVCCLLSSDPTELLSNQWLRSVQVEFPPFFIWFIDLTQSVLGALVSQHKDDDDILVPSTFSTGSF